MSFDAKTESIRVINFIRDYMDKNGPNSPIVIGVSGGKDSAAAAAASVAAVGTNRVIGVMLPNGIQSDLGDAIGCCNFLKIPHMEINIGPLVKETYNAMRYSRFKDLHEINSVVKTNHPARLRMSVLYMIANQIGGRVCNTCNMSETYVGYDTKWGDQCGDFSPFQNYTASEVIEIGIALGVPEKAMCKAPADGMCGQTDEERWGFTYVMLDKYLRGGELNKEAVTQIEKMHRMAMHKLTISIPSTPYHPDGSRNLGLPGYTNIQPETSAVTETVIETGVKVNPGYIYDAEHDRYVKADS